MMAGSRGTDDVKATRTPTPHSRNGPRLGLTLYPFAGSVMTDWAPGFFGFTWPSVSLFGRMRDRRRAGQRAYGGTRAMTRRRQRLFQAGRRNHCAIRPTLTRNTAFTDGGRRVTRARKCAKNTITKAGIKNTTMIAISHFMGTARFVSGVVTSEGVGGCH